MAAPVNAFGTADARGIREDLSDIIYDISPTDTPFMSGVAKVKADNTYHEWQTDSLATAADDNAHTEGDDTTPAASSPTTRVGNYTQIFKKSVVITGTLEAVKKAGRGREIAYQLAKRGKELRLDMEKSMLANKARVAGSESVAGILAGVPAWLATNTSAGSGGSDPTGDGTDARMDGTQRTFTEALLKPVLQSCWDEGGDPSYIFVGSHNKQIASTFSGNATREESAASKRVTASVDVYVSDFGELRIVPNRFQRARDALVLQMDMWAAANLRAPFQEPLAKTGDSEKRQIIAECTLVSRNEKASGIVADLSTA